MPRFLRVHEPGFEVGTPQSAPCIKCKKNPTFGRRQQLLLSVVASIVFSTDLKRTWSQFNVASYLHTYSAIGIHFDETVIFGNKAESADGSTFP